MDFKSNTTTSKMLDLPLLKNLDSTEIAVQGQNALAKFRKGEYSIFTFMKIAAVGTIGYFSWVYVLPPLFIALGQVSATIGAAILVGFTIIMLPVIFKGLRRLTRWIHKGIIKYDPFGELEEQKEKMLVNQKVFRTSQGNITKLKQDMETEASVSEKEAKELEKSILADKAKADRLKNELSEMEKSGGKAARESDDYVNKSALLIKTLSDANRDGKLLEQKNSFVRKYGSRAAVMKKFSQKLVYVGTAMDSKIEDFDATVEILRRDYEFAKKSRAATETAKSAMFFSKSWELDYALDLVTNTIAEDIAITTGNLNDINKLTAGFDMDSDEMFANLDQLTNQIKIGTTVPESKKYSNAEYQLSSEDKKASGGFGDIFN